jgi:hypothetical protein
MIDPPALSEKNYEEFVKMYEKAKTSGEKSFDFYGQEILVDFATYLLQYYHLKKDFKINYV